MIEKGLKYLVKLNHQIIYHHHVQIQLLELEKNKSITFNVYKFQNIKSKLIGLHFLVMNIKRMIRFLVIVVVKVITVYRMMDYIHQITL